MWAPRDLGSKSISENNFTHIDFWLTWFSWPKHFLFISLIVSAFHHVHFLSSRIPESWWVNKLYIAFRNPPINACHFVPAWWSSWGWLSEAFSSKSDCIITSPFSPSLSFDGYNLDCPILGLHAARHSSLERDNRENTVLTHDGVCSNHETRHETHRSVHVYVNIILLGAALRVSKDQRPQRWPRTRSWMTTPRSTRPRCTSRPTPRSTPSSCPCSRPDCFSSFFCHRK